jgi:hypothetical protein
MELWQARQLAASSAETSEGRKTDRKSKGAAIDKSLLFKMDMGTSILGLRE